MEEFTIESIVGLIENDIATAKHFGRYDVDANFVMEEGVLISYRDAQKLLDAIKKPANRFPTKNVCFFDLKNGKYLTENDIEITTDLLTKYPHQITKDCSFIILD